MEVVQLEEFILFDVEASKLSVMSERLNEGSSTISSDIKEYQQQLEALCNAINPSESRALLDFTFIFIEGLDKFINGNVNFERKDCVFVKRFSQIINEYLLLPGSKIPDAHMLSHFKDPAWVRPVNAYEMKHFLNYITDKDYIEETIESLEIDDVLKFHDVENGLAESSIDLDRLSFLNNNSRKLTDSPVLDDSLSIEGNDEPLLDLKDLERNYILSEIDECGSESIAGDMGVIQGIQLDESQKELIDLVKSELYELADPECDLRFVIEPDGNAKESRQVLILEQIENVSNAVKLIGLDALSECAKSIAKNINLLISVNLYLTQGQCDFLNLWPEKLLDYLNNIHKPCSSDQLLSYLSNNIWPENPENEINSDFINKLKNPDLVVEELEQRQVIALESDVDITLPDDVNHELLEGLLHELPTQTSGFSDSIQNICHHGNMKDLDNAQRIAHTLKGAANVVGVKGIANLTHHLEDILQIQSKAKAVPTKDLAETLINASDCLEAMCEALLGIDEAPVNSISVLQDVLDWANKLDKDGVVQSNEDGDDKWLEFDPAIHQTRKSSYESTHEETGADTLSENNNIKMPSAESMLRIPSKLADDLLRIAGETLISTSQIQEQIKLILKKQALNKLHNQALQKLSFDLDHMIDVRGLASNMNATLTDDDFDPLEMDQYHELHTFSRRLIEIAADSIGFSHALEDDISLLSDLVVSQDKLQKESEGLVLRTRMVPIKTIVPRLQRGVRQVARITGKNVDINIIDNDTYMDSNVLNNIIEPLMHLLRNAVDHGIESYDERVEMKKSETGAINLVFLRKGDQIEINIQDDGRGLDLKQIKTKAQNEGLITKDQDLGSEETIRLILEPGFTTRNLVTQVSGRGIGLDVVNMMIREQKGTLDIKSDFGKGCNFTLRLPISSFSTHSLLVRVRQYVYAISNRSVEEIVYPGSGEFLEIDGNLVFKIGDHIYSTVLIDEMLDLPEDTRAINRQSRPILLVKEDSGVKRAVLVQEVIDSRDVVVKPMGKYLPRFKGIIGATVLGDGSIAPVLDMPELLSAQTQKYCAFATSKSQQQVVIKQPYILVVDDSLSARNSLAQFIEDLGLDVRTARDGMEAVSLIEVRKPDLILVDMEMPRMNGLELTTHVRATEATHNMPVIMITSRSSDKHRKAAMDKGVNHYMVKPFAEDELAENINNLLKTG